MTPHSGRVQGSILSVAFISNWSSSQVGWSEEPDLLGIYPQYTACTRGEDCSNGILNLVFK